MSSAPEPGPTRAGTRPTAVVIAVLIVADVVSSFESSMMFVALPRIIVAFQATPATASWVLTSFLLVAAASAAVCGRLGDIYGRRRLLVVLLLVSAVGSVVSISTGTLAGIIVGRAIQGVSGGILPLCFGLAREHLPPRRVPVAVALVAGAALLAGALGTLLSGVLVDAFDWNFIFVFAAIVAVLAALTCALLPASAGVAPVERVDWVGGVLFAPAIALVLFGVTQSTTWSWLDVRTVGTIAAGLVLSAIWVRWELRATSPMINIRLFRSRPLALTMLATVLLATGPIGVMGLLLPLIMQTSPAAPVGLGLSATGAGLIGSCVTVLGFALSPVSGRISARAGARRSLLIGAFFGLLTAIGLATLHGSVTGIIAVALVFTVTASFILTSLPNLVVERVPAENTSEATGVYMVTRTAFTGVGTSLATLILSLSIVAGTTYSTVDAYNGVFLLIGLCSLAALLVSLLIPARRGPSPATDLPLATATEP